MSNSPNYAAEIEKLTNRIAELEQENANLRSVDKTLDETISRNTAMFEALTANSPAGIALTGPDRRIVRVVHSAMGFMPWEVVGLPLEAIIHPMDQRILVDCYVQLLSRRVKSVEFEGRVCRPDGSIGWVSATLTDMLDDPNVQAIICNHTDVTEKVRHQLMLAEFAAIAGNADRVIFSKDLDGQIVTWNPGAQKFYGYTSEEIAGCHVRKLVPAELQEEERMVRERLRDTPEPIELRTIRVCKDGSRVDVLVELTPLLDRYGRPWSISQASRLIE